jgi:Uma2 family endonuclease
MTPARSSSILSDSRDALALEAELPYSDGRPMPDGDFHVKVCSPLWVLLQDYFADRDDVYIATNMAVYYRRPAEGAAFDLAQALDEECDDPVVLAPDLFVVRGVEKRDRRSYQVRGENRGPEFVIEVSGASTVRRDLGSKRSIYENNGVLEYLLFDPTGEGLLEPRLQFFVHREGRLERAEPDERGRYRSEVLELEFADTAQGLRFFEIGSESPLLNLNEARDAERAAKEAALVREQAERQAKVEALAREQAERQAKEAERQAKVEALAREQAERQAKVEALAREQAERQAKEAALEELAALRERLNRLEQKPEGR